MFTPFLPHVASILDPFWAHYGSILVSLGGSWEGGAKRPRNISIWGSLWAPHGLHFSSKIGTFFNEKMHHFFHQLLMGFWLHFGRLLGSILHQKASLRRKMWFYQNGRLAYTRAPFSRVGGLKIHPKCHLKSIRKSMHFFIEKMSAKVSPRGSQQGPKIAPKDFQKESKKNTKKSEKKGAKGRVRSNASRTGPPQTPP